MNNVLKDKLPPTDSRLRMDVRLWEEGKQEESSAEKTRLEQNQRKRKSDLKKILTDKDFSGDDCLYYTPKFFEKAKHPVTGEDMYVLKDQPGGRNYWRDRDNGHWNFMPKIYEDNCEAFH